MDPFFSSHPRADLPTRFGFGMLRIDPTSELHRAAVRHALERGVRDFDLGYLRDPAAIERYRLLVDLRETLGAPESIRVFARGEVGEPSTATFAPFAPTAAGIDFAYFVSDPEFAFSRSGGDFRALDTAIRRDFALLEELVSQKKIAFYGVASAAFTYPKDDPEYLSIAHLASAEDGTRAYPGFRAVEFPFNLYESSALRLENQNLPASPTEANAIEAARAHGLEIYTRRPFDAITETQLVRLVPYPDHHRLDLDEAVKRTLEAAMAAESELLARFASTTIDTPIHWAHRLRRQLVQVVDIEQWKQILARKIEPELGALLARADDADGLDEKDRATIARYRDTMEALLLSVRLWFEKAAAERSERIRARLVEAAPTLRSERGIARAALRIYRSLPGLNCVFVGMRSPRYVDDALDAGAPIPFPEAESAIEAAETAIREHLRSTRLESPSAMPDGEKSDSPGSRP